MEKDQYQKEPLPALILGAIGVVFGDIGTSPLYAFREAFVGKHASAPTPDNVLGVLSLMLWTLTLVVTIKYVYFIMRADNRGEGGIMAMIALIPRMFPATSRRHVLLVGMGLFGAALFYGDSILTPAISVLSAVEGVKIAAPSLEHFVVPLALIILSGMFYIQTVGTASIGKMFGPIMLVWFSLLAILGIVSVLQTPNVLEAINPYYAFDFFSRNGLVGMTVLGAVVLCVTGAEALYADMGHFGKTPIRLGWLFFVFPALILNYFGQGALMLRNPDAVKNPFYLLAPDWALYPMIALATLATIVASQAVITGAFSLTRQAIQLGYLPRMQIRHTSDSEIGQIYVPFINYTLFVGVVALVLGFQSSSNLAAAYGIAVTGSMTIDSILAFTAMWAIWKWKLSAAMACMTFFLLIDLAFLAANIPKILHGGWFPLAIGLLVFTLLTTWKRGREMLLRSIVSENIDLDTFIEGILAFPHARVAGTAIFLHATGKGVPHALLHNLTHNKVMHERVVVLTVTTEDVPVVPKEDRVEITELSGGFYRMQIRYGFREEPNIPAALEGCTCQGNDFHMMKTSFFLSRETLIVVKNIGGMALWREKLFVWMTQNAESAMTFFRLPPNRVLELGTQIEI